MISRSEKMLLMVLADAHQDRACMRTFPKVATIAEDAMVCERQAQRLLASLERKGVIRREYPNGTGRDRLTYYFFLELDNADESQSAVKQPAKMGPEKSSKAQGKGDKMSPLFPEEGRQKGDIRVTSGAPLLINKNNKSNRDQLPPVVPASGDEEELAIGRAVSQVCSALDIPENQRRRRSVIAGAVKRACEKGDPAPTVALQMIAAVREQDALFLQGALKFKFGFDKFIGAGIWRSQDRWGWDARWLERRAAASVGIA
jgi:hypothetical protein